MAAPPPTLAGKKMGLLISCPPQHPNFKHALLLAKSALQLGLQVYVYIIDDAVTGISHPDLLSLQSDNLKLFACAFTARQRNVPIDDAATFGGLGALSDIITATDRFLSFNA